MSELGRLHRVELRDIWQSEAQDFTPWLAREDNLALLAETLGIDLELEAVEQNVGPFRADILCRNRVNGAPVVIENQLTASDHRHLGQVLTYSAVLQAGYIVWIASCFSKEHLATLDWLNDTTDEDLYFFAIEMCALKVDNSRPALDFRAVSFPNIWRVRKKSESSNRKMKSNSEPNGKACLSHLLMYTITDQSKKICMSVQELLLHASQQSNYRTAKFYSEVLGGFGLRALVEKGQCFIIVANWHAGLAAIFRGTEWSNSGWKEALREIDGVVALGPRRFKGVSSRALKVPLAPINEDTHIQSETQK